MKPAMKNVLVIPGKEKLKDGPGGEWLEQLEANLNLVLKKFTKEPVLTLTPESKISKEFFSEPVCLVLFMNAAYSSSQEYMEFLNNLSTMGGASIQQCIRIDTSVQDMDNLPDVFATAISVKLTDQVAGGNQWIGEDTPSYWSRLLDLAAEIKPYEQVGDKPVDERSGVKVYLAQTDSAMGSGRNILRRELIEHGYGIVPSTDLKYQSTDLKSHIQNQVDKSRLAIHLLGNSYGETLKEAGCSIAEAQVKYITEYLEAIENDPVHATKELERLIWIDPDYNPLDTRQEEFINQLKGNIENLHRTEIIQTPLELFKTLVINRLRKRESGSIRNLGDGPGGEKFIYILHSPDDQTESMDLANLLSENGMEAGMLDYSKPQVELLKDHKRYLQECDGAVVYYGHTNRPWLSSKVMDLLKAPGLGRKEKLETRQVLAAKKDLLEDINLPNGIILIKEPDLSQAVEQLLKNLK